MTGGAAVDCGSPPAVGHNSDDDNMKRDWISVIETGYRLGGSDEEWLDELLACAAPLIDQGLPPIAWVRRHAPNTIRRVAFAASVGAEYRRWIRLAHRGDDPRLYDFLYGSGRCVGTAQAELFPRLPGERPKLERVTAGRAADLLLAAGHTGTGDTVAFAAYSTGRITLRKDDYRRWAQLGAHLGAALRLRLAACTLDLASAAVEAVLEPDGRLQDARGPGREQTARDRLRYAVKQMERSRCAGRRQSIDEALAAWEALISGRWSLVEHFDSDGRRYIVAVRNDPLYPDPRGLTLRERQVAEYVGMGQSSGQIAYALGISPSSVTDHSARAQRKLGLSSWTELAAFFARNGPRVRLAEVAIRDNRLLIGSYPLLPEASVQPLTNAERDILAALLAGSTNADIAGRRAVAARTVANQVQAIFRKLGVRSRGELAARLQSGG
ncbi:regulatory LuxR family protein [Thiocapsa rosea]|uniref:Regulatory LuxR family protein n=2 Tax=Thiocapsa rosea TaxID=69360 RepID=A0A495VGA4_9GAMM|nr:regulatory LuxR family protein [Thiocapsa rosea]